MCGKFKAMASWAAAKLIGTGSMLSLFRMTIIVGLLAANVEMALAATGDYVHLSAGGFMTSGLEISIDLDSGLAIKRTMPSGSLKPGERPHWLESKRQLDSEELGNLINTIKSSLTAGLESQKCL